jgi:hypothetical protein
MIRDGLASRGCAVQDGTVDLSWMLRSTWHGPEQERDPKRWRSEEAKAIVAAVRRAGAGGAHVERASEGDRASRFRRRRISPQRRPRRRARQPPGPRSGSQLPSTGSSPAHLLIAGLLMGGGLTILLGMCSRATRGTRRQYSFLLLRPEAYGQPAGPMSSQALAQLGPELLVAWCARGGGSAQSWWLRSQGSGGGAARGAGACRGRGRHGWIPAPGSR